ncbi:hypothetical protein [Sphingobium fluviale]|uniref:Uncharacterized protein n=1 Tax=Sphingobium fluviale TaxID=2506423 RepID=A0A4Q1KBR3_9SPHN|nr:hypothetical protein [Sphingobium fluviale]RXR23686.1 hypothetical protein EQG66_15055 [Sphingobium fluviale]
MERNAQISGIGDIFALLAGASARPRYAFLVLQLVADARGKAGPIISAGGSPMLLRDWLCGQLMPMSSQPARRAGLRARVTAAIAGELCGDPVRDAVRIDQAVEEQALAVGTANVSRAISDLARAGLMTRHYAGYATNHENRGGGRHAVYVVEPDVLRLLRKPVATPTARRPFAPRQGELFAA